MNEAGASPPPGIPDVGELLELVTRLDADNERLRLRVLEVMEWTEEAVTAQVVAERESAEAIERNAELASELDAIRSTKTWRLLGPPRRVYGMVRQRLGRRPT